MRKILLLTILLSIAFSQDGRYERINNYTRFDTRTGETEYLRDGTCYIWYGGGTPSDVSTITAGIADIATTGTAISASYGGDGGGGAGGGGAGGGGGGGAG